MFLMVVDVRNVAFLGQILFQFCFYFSFAFTSILLLHQFFRFTVELLCPFVAECDNSRPNFYKNNAIGCVVECDNPRSQHDGVLLSVITQVPTRLWLLSVAECDNSSPNRMVCC